MLLYFIMLFLCKALAYGWKFYIYSYLNDFNNKVDLSRQRDHLSPYILYIHNNLY